METNENSEYVILTLEVLGWICVYSKKIFLNLDMFLKIKISKHLRGQLVDTLPIPQFTNVTKFINVILCVPGKVLMYLFRLILSQSDKMVHGS